MKRFAVSCLFHHTPSGITYHKPVIVSALSREEAEGKELNILLKQYPVEHGWTGHSTVALEIVSTNLN